MKTRPDALATAENESGHTKPENNIRRPRYSLRRVRECQTYKTESDALGTAEKKSGSAKHEN
jgi:hypothetical protein